MMMITANAYELATDLAHWRIAAETRLPLEEVVETREDGQTYYTERFESVFESYLEHYLLALRDYQK